jgi:hypothetical protein
MNNNWQNSPVHRLLGNGLYNQDHFANFLGSLSLTRQSSPIRPLLGEIPKTKRKVFVSYYHKEDQYYYNELSEVCSDRLELFYDNSLDREINSDNDNYVLSTIAQDHIKGSSVTLVLCGPNSYKRKWIDWEIYRTLEKDKPSIVGIILPNNIPLHNTSSVASRLHYLNPSDEHGYQHANSIYLLPRRLKTNLETGFAKLITWTEITKNPHALQSIIEIAINEPKSKSNNCLPKMQRNLS